ncbi:hypothetical protein, partial [Sphaerotilus uruguayifluvii]|uniref:hypothetical protein n=1 Tax=Sphaerotilus uruguayifluvii TaxID=2735897 RepID=UPI001C2D7E2C
EELRALAQHQPAVRPSRLSGLAPQEIVNTLLEGLPVVSNFSGNCVRYYTFRTFHILGRPHP